MKRLTTLLPYFEYDFRQNAVHTTLVAGQRYFFFTSNSPEYNISYNYQSPIIDERYNQFEIYKLMFDFVKEKDLLEKVTTSLNIGEERFVDVADFTRVEDDEFRNTLRHYRKFFVEHFPIVVLGNITYEKVEPVIPLYGVLKFAVYKQNKSKLEKVNGEYSCTTTSDQLLRLKPAKIEHLTECEASWKYIMRGTLAEDSDHNERSDDDYLYKRRCYLGF